MPRSLGRHITRVSRVHCRLVRAGEGAGVVLEDAAQNGTWVNGARVGRGGRCPLRSGDRITLLYNEGVPLLEYEFFGPGGGEPEVGEQREPREQREQREEPQDGSDGQATPSASEEEEIAPPVEEKRARTEERLPAWAGVAQVGAFAIGAYVLMGLSSLY